jgi:hypothetical protein
MTKPNALLAMGANRATEAREIRDANVLPLIKVSAQRLVDLTELVAELRDRVEALEAR